MTEAMEYRVRVHHEDGQMWAEVEDLPGCFVTGENLDELKEALAEAIGLYLSSDASTVTVRGLEFQPPPGDREVSVRAKLVAA